MSKLLQNLTKRKLINPPKWLPENTMYLCQMGSMAYGVNQNDSDYDVYGFCVPPKDMIFKPLNLCIPGFDKLNNFESWQQHHVDDQQARKEYDFSIHNITKFFKLVMDNNPNMIDALFVPRNCILHSTQMSELMRENRKMFLHKGSWHKFKGYAYSQMHKMKIKTPKTDSNRYESWVKHGYDLKFAYHIVRLLNEVEQIMTEHDLDLQRNREQLKAIRRGEWSYDQIVNYFNDKEKELEQLYNKTSLPYGPDVDSIRELLFECLNMHYDFNSVVVQDTKAENKLAKIQEILNA